MLNGWKEVGFFLIIKPEVVVDAGAMGCLDAKQGFGQVAGEYAVDEGITRAKKHGVLL